LIAERPQDRGVARYGEDEEEAPGAARLAGGRWMALAVLAKVARHRVFWLLAGSFFVCGLTTNGLVGTHMIAYCGDHGISPVAAGGLLAVMGVFDLIGTTASGWLTDRYNPRLLLAAYYGVRGLSLMALPFADFGQASLGVFALLYGLNWIATLPPTVRIANETFGEHEGPVVYGWIQVAHQIGAATAAYGAGLARDISGHYDMAFFVTGCIAIGMMVMMQMSARQMRSAQPC